jgi:trehalose utilization protein
MRPLLIFLLPLLVSLSSMAAPIRVTVWDERQPAQKQVYTNFLGNQIADHLRQSSDFSVRSVALDDPQQGLADLKDTDVLIWWGHVRHGEIKPETAREIVRQIKDRGLALIALHSAHWSQPFVEAMHERARIDALAALDPRERETAILIETNLFPNFRSVPKYNSLRSPAVLYRKPTNGPVEVRLTLPNCCFPAYRADAKPSQIRILRPFHPIARGIPPIFTIEQTEMYDEPFHVPLPDEVILEERWEKGEWFRSGSVWQIGKGKVFYFRPGHEVYPVFKNQNVLRLLENATRWLAANGQSSP